MEKDTFARSVFRVPAKRIRRDREIVKRILNNSSILNAHTDGAKHTQLHTDFNGTRQKDMNGLVGWVAM